MLINVRTSIVTIRAMVPSLFSIRKKASLIMCTTSALLFILVCYFMFDLKTNAHSTRFFKRVHILEVNETSCLLRHSNEGISLERNSECNLINRSQCYTTQKSLVVSFWRESSRKKWLVKNILKVFPEDHFTCLIMVHDNSSWASYLNRERFIWIHVNAQKRFWFLKRFLTPPILKAYNYIWVLDDDTELLFDPLHYECVIAQLNISLSSPGRLKGITSHSITRVNEKFAGKIGRWTDFVEIGPIFVASSSAWECLWHYLSAFVGLGWGLDLIWCKLLTHKCSLNTTNGRSCAVLDIFEANHLSESIGTTVAGGQEIPAYYKYYNSFRSEKQNLGPLVSDRAIYSSCNTTR